MSRGFGFQRQQPAFKLYFKFSQQKQLLQITASPSDSVQRIKQKILGQSDLDPNILIIQFRNHSLLDDNKKLYQLGILQSQTLKADFISAKSGVQYSLTNIRKRPKLVFSKTRPQYRLIDKGLNLEALCKNYSCKLYKKPVFINKGFGKFNIGKQGIECTCPACKQETEAAHNFGYYKSRVTIKGRRDGGRDGGRKYELQQQGTDQKFYSFFQPNDKIQNWNYLQVEASEVR